MNLKEIIRILIVFTLVVISSVAIVLWSNPGLARQSIILKVIRGEVCYTPPNTKKSACSPVPRNIEKPVEREGSIELKKGGQVMLLCPPSDPKMNPAQTIRDARYEDRTINIIRVCPPPPNPQGDCGVILAGGRNDRIPYIISPRYTLVTQQDLTLRWNSVEQATSYQVLLYQVGFDRSIWETNYTSQELSNQKSPHIITIEYTGAPLTVGNNYKLVVKAELAQGEELSSEHEEKNLKCYIPERRRGVERLKFQLAETPQFERETQFSDGESLPSKVDRLSLARLYAMASHYTKAMTMLEHLAEQFPDADVYLALGNLYAESGLNLLSKNAYDVAETRTSDRLFRI
jgi:hypothetical protein